VAVPSGLNVSLLTPASDVITGVDGVDVDVIFGRAGNDTIYGFDPIADRNAANNVDILVADLFDNSADEFNVVLELIAGNSLAILNAPNIPSIGQDRFVLGDEFQSFYTTSDPLSLVTTNFLGFNEFAVVYDFSATQDKIQLNGRREDYRLLKLENTPIENVGSFSGYALFSLQTGSPDLVSLIVQKPSVTLDLNADYFEFVGSKSKGKNKPADRKIAQFGTLGLDFGFGVAVDPSNNLYLTGSTSGSLEGPNKGSGDVWLSKFDSSGNKVFGQQLGSASGDTSTTIVTDKNGNYYIAGITGGSFVSGKQSPDGTDAFVAKYSSNGTLIWGRQVGTPTAGGFSTSGFGLQVDEQGNVYLSGLTIKDNPPPRVLDFSVQDDSWVTKFDSNGTQQWFTTIKDPKAPVPLNTTPFFDESYDVAVDKTGNSYLVGWTQGLSKESDPSRLLLKYDAWISKVKPDGQIEWTQQFGSSDQGLEVAWGVDTDSQGNIYVSGWTTGNIGTREGQFANSKSYDVWLSKFTPTGTQLWTKQVGTAGDDGVYYGDLQIDAQDNIYLSGYTNDNLGTGRPDSSYNAWVGKFDTNGNNQWLQKFGVKDQVDYATRLAIDNTGKVFVTGFTEGFLGASNGADAKGAGVDAWLAQLSASNGRLQKFEGGTGGEVISIDNPVAVPSIDISSRLVTSDKLPSGDNRIITTEGNSKGINGVDYGRLSSNLSSAFDPKAPNSISSTLSRTIGNSVNNTSRVDYKGTDRNDVYAGGSADDKLNGEKGNDTLYGRGGTDTIEGGEGDDTLYGGEGNDQIRGGKGNDTLIGFDPNSSTALNEIDLLNGGENFDVFVLGDADRAFYTGKGNDNYALIDDFRVGEDKIQLNGSAGNYSLRSDVASLPKGTGIFRGDDLIGVVKDVKGLSLTNTGVFTFV
jgi:hypothetical protein